RGHVEPHKFVGRLPKGANCACRPTLGYRVCAAFHRAQELLRFRPRFVRGQPSMLADGNAPRPAILPELRDVDLFTGRETHDPETRERFVPEECAILPRFAPESINPPFRDPSGRHVRPPVPLEATVSIR